MGRGDLREWLEQLEAAGELKRISALVDWDRELGAITRKNFDRDGPALLFKRIKGYEQGRCRRLFTGGLASPRRMALMLGLDKEAPLKEIIEKTRQRFKERIKPVPLASGPVKEVILKGEDVDLLELPVPKWHHQDAARYICTLCGIITRDPDTGIINVGLYRGAVHGRNKIAMPVVASQHMGRHYYKYKERGLPMPVAIAIGWGPSLGFLASSGIPPSLSEYDVMGAICQKPVEVVRCETSDLEVPASAEIAIEGYFSPDPATYELEGPFGEYTGYYGGERLPRPVIFVECVTQRQDPIFCGSLEGMGPGHPNETAVMGRVAVSALARNVLEASGVPGVVDAVALPPSSVTNLVIQIHKTYQSQPKQVAFALWGSAMPMWTCKNILVVDKDIDIYDFPSLEWALAYRVNPAEGDVLVVPDMHGTALDPCVPAEKRDSTRFGAAMVTRTLIDATKTWKFGRRKEWGGEFYPPTAFTLSPEDEELVKRRWKEYGFEGD